MGLFKLLFKNKKDKTAELNGSDGQEKYFKEDQMPPKKISPKTEENKESAAKAQTKKSAPKAEAKKEEPKKTSSVKAEAKKPAPKKVDLVEDDAVSNDDEEVAVENSGKPVRNGKFDIRKSKDGRFYFNLYASNKQVIAYSQMYASTTSAMTGIKSVMANATKAAIEDTTLKKPEPKNFPKWEIYIDKAGEFRFRLYASNGSCVCHSHGYASKATCKGGIESIQRFASESADIDKSYLNK